MNHVKVRSNPMLSHLSPVKLWWFFAWVSVRSTVKDDRELRLCSWQSNCASWQAIPHLAIHSIGDGRDFDLPCLGKLQCLRWRCLYLLQSRQEILTTPRISIRLRWQAWIWHKSKRWTCGERCTTCNTLNMKCFFEFTSELENTAMPQLYMRNCLIWTNRYRNRSQWRYLRSSLSMSYFFSRVTDWLVHRHHKWTVLLRIWRRLDTETKYEEAIFSELIKAVRYQYEWADTQEAHNKILKVLASTSIRWMIQKTITRLMTAKRNWVKSQSGEKKDPATPKKPRIAEVIAHSLKTLGTHIIPPD